MRKRLWIQALIALSVTSIPLATISLLAQEPGTAKTPARKGYDATRRVPPYFNQVGLSPEQREEIYKIRAKHMERIEALQQQLEEQEAKMLADSEGVLTDAQRRLLEQRRDAAKEKTKGKTKSTSKDEDDEPAKGKTKSSTKDDGPARGKTKSSTKDDEPAKTKTTRPSSKTVE